ncbi:hypothetical protein POM88_038564 [Heracleum sosnowskyi]|uniref:Uncharacterized protein n=1 Tax=Heracleum sosnowskyi TaxID=360622 RepID=A0AAD8M8G0_9APIA|nr:hypothetical protein POM88_038564 [Heracleum sosnowskyi]
MSMLENLEDRVEKLATDGVARVREEDYEVELALVYDFLLIVKHFTFRTFFENEKIFGFRFDYLDNIYDHLVDPLWGYMEMFKILYNLPKDDVTEQRYQECMLSNIEYFVEQLELGGMNFHSKQGANLDDLEKDIRVTFKNEAGWGDGVRREC